MSSTLSEALNIYPELPIFSVEVISLKSLSYPRRPMATALYHIFIFLQAIAEKYGITGVDKVYDSLMTLIDKGLLTAYGSWSVTNFIQIFILYNLNQESPGFISSGIDEIMLVWLRDPITRAFMSERTINIHATLARLIPLLKQRYFNIVPSSIPPNPIVVDRQYNYCPQCQPFQPAFSNSSCSYDASSVTHDTGSFPRPVTLLPRAEPVSILQNCLSSGNSGIPPTSHPGPTSQPWVWPLLPTTPLPIRPRGRPRKRKAPYTPTPASPSLPVIISATPHPSPLGEEPVAGPSTKFSP